MTLQIGSLVRAPRPQDSPTDTPNSSPPQLNCRATIATIEPYNEVTLLFDPLTPQPLHPSVSPFLIVPTISLSSIDEEEHTLPITSLCECLPFELKQDDFETTDLPVWKDRGDALLNRNDPSSAAAYYDAIVTRTSHPSNTTIGSTIIVNVKRRALLAEVDCMDQTLKTLDVTLVETQQELTLHQNDILVGPIQDSKDHFQIRTLLNLTRCLILLAHTHSPTKYGNAAVKASTMALTLLQALEGPSDESAHPTKPMEDTARILRARANQLLGPSRFSHSRRDLKVLLEETPDHTEAQKLTSELDQHERRIRTADRNLATNLCTWIYNATDSTEETRREQLASQQASQETETPKTDGEGTLSKHSKTKVVSDHPLGTTYRYLTLAVTLVMVGIVYYAVTTNETLTVVEHMSSVSWLTHYCC